MKRSINTLVAAISLVGLAGTASAEEWRCRYTGEWQMDGSDTKAEITWKVTWSLKKDEWSVSGHDSDKYGYSRLSGTCKGSSCSFKQRYESGEEKGNEFLWAGAFEDRRVDDTHGTLKIKGTWMAKDGSSKGTWNAEASCVKE